MKFIKLLSTITLTSSMPLTVVSCAEQDTIITDFYHSVENAIFDFQTTRTSVVVNDADIKEIYITMEDHKGDSVHDLYDGPTIINKEYWEVANKENIDNRHSEFVPNLEAVIGSLIEVMKDGVTIMDNTGDDNPIKDTIIESFNNIITNVENAPSYNSETLRNIMIADVEDGEFLDSYIFESNKEIFDPAIELQWISKLYEFSSEHNVHNYIIDVTEITYNLLIQVLYKVTEILEIYSAY